jgi:hypothetical protein
VATLASLVRKRVERRRIRIVAVGGGTPQIRKKEHRVKFAKLAAGAAIAGLAALAPAGVALAAGGGYGPAVPPSNGAPGGFSTVLETLYITNYASHGPVSLGNGAKGTLSTPAGDVGFPDDEVVFTGANLGQIQAARSQIGLGGYTLNAAFGVFLETQTGKMLTLKKPLTLVIQAPGITSATKVFELTGPSTAKPVAASASAGEVSVSLFSDPDLVVATPPPAAASSSQTSSTQASGTVAGATSVHTGLPFTGEEYLAGLLGALGVAGVGTGVVMGAKARRGALAKVDPTQRP